MSSLLALIICPLLIVVVTLCTPRVNLIARAVAFLMWVETGIAVAGCGPYLWTERSSPVPLGYGFRLDGVAALFLILNTLVVAAALTHAVGFFGAESESEHPPSRRQVREFYVFAALFLFAMDIVVAADNLGFLWIAIEATTLLSAPLVYYHRTRTSLEATWKYLIICSVGIAFAFFGTAIFYAASQRIPGLSEGSLSISQLTSSARLLPHGLLRLGFVFTLLGYGTKAGLFPLHSWLPDAHSEAPSPASAILSGALLNCALVAIWRTSDLTAASGEGAFVQKTLLPMGLATVLSAGLFLLKQRDLKRLLAYSSMENVGLMAVAIAIGTGSGFALQAINHSLVKVALFLLAGNLLQEYGTKNIRDIRGLLTSRPSQGILLLLAFIAVAGTPPFGSFLAEWQILSVAGERGFTTSVVITLIGLTIAFIALMGQVVGIVFGEPSRKEEPIGELVQFNFNRVVVPALLIVTSVLLGLMLPPTAMALAKGLRS
jgi:hydrogenase-4 component F